MSLQAFAATDVQNVVVHQTTKDGDGFVYHALATQGGIADVVIVGLVFVDWMMRQFGGQG